MTTSQAFELEKKIAKLKLSDGQVLKLAREASHNAALVSLAMVTRHNASELIRRVEEIEQTRILELEISLI